MEPGRDTLTLGRASPEQVAEIRAKLLRALVELRTEDCKLATLRIRIAVMAAGLERDLEGQGVDVRPRKTPKAAGKTIESFAQLMEQLVVQ